ncbi:MAG: aryl-sulfate sulfotransferase [Ignavibacteria bacterium]|nr:aryl-sulfate sulfotransferase [Ignavibacteria bacterium]
MLNAWEVKTSAQAIAAGLNHSASIWPDHIIEVQPSGTTGGTIVWKWHAWDHLIQDYDPTKANYGVVANHPELLDINVSSTASGDWMHVNGISYNADLDQIVFSSHNLDEFYVIDHSTTTAEAASHTGGQQRQRRGFFIQMGKTFQITELPAHKCLMLFIAVTGYLTVSPAEGTLWLSITEKLQDSLWW